MASIKPSALFFTKKLRFPESLSVIVVYLLIILIVSILIYFVSRPLSVEIAKLGENAPSLISNIVDRLPFLQGKIDTSSSGALFRDLLTTISREFSNLGSAVENALSFTVSAFGAIVEVITVIIVSIYLFLDREKILDYIIYAFKFDRKNFYHAYSKIETQLGAWVRGQLFLGFIVGFFTWLGLVILDIRFAVPLGVLAGILEVVPIIGPIITGVILTVIGFSIDPVKGLLSLGLSILIQQLENHILVPNVMKKAVGLSPVITIISILIGSKLLGILGAIIAVPLAAMIAVLVETYLENRKS